LGIAKRIKNLMSVVNIQKEILSEIDFYQGTINMPEGFEIDKEKLSIDILTHQFDTLNNKKINFPFSRTWDMLNTYVREHMLVKYQISLVNMQSWGHIFHPYENSTPMLAVNPMDLRNSPDYVFLYGVQSNECFVNIHYDNKKQKGKSKVLDLKTNDFIIFPAICIYNIMNKNLANIVQTITYEKI